MEPSSPPAMVTFGGRGVLRSRMDAGRAHSHFGNEQEGLRGFLPPMVTFGGRGVPPKRPPPARSGSILGNCWTFRAIRRLRWLPLGRGVVRKRLPPGQPWFPFWDAAGRSQRLPAFGGYLWEGGGPEAPAPTQFGWSSFPAQRCQKNKATPLKEFLPGVPIVPWERLPGCAGRHRDWGSGPVGARLSRQPPYGRNRAVRRPTLHLCIAYIDYLAWSSRHHV